MTTAIPKLHCGMVTLLRVALNADRLRNGGRRPQYLWLQQGTLDLLRAEATGDVALALGGLRPSFEGVRIAVPGHTYRDDPDELADYAGKRWPI